MEPSEPRGRGGRFFLVLLLGIVLGIAGTVLAPQWAGPYLRLFEEGALVEGQVLDKALESDRLLLKITTEQGVFLATFTQRQKEIDLLVDPGDTITLNVPEYEPFLENPAIERVRKPERPIEPEEPPPETEVEEKPPVGEPKEMEPPPSEPGQK